VQPAVSSSRVGDIMTVMVSGDVDLATSAAVETAVIAAVAADGVTAVTVDLSGVDFLDSSGIALLLKGRRSADERGVGFRVTGAHGPAERILEMTGVLAHLSGEPDPA
jgi:anti-sigma B factor antagonist